MDINIESVSSGKSRQSVQHWLEKRGAWHLMPKCQHHCLGTNESALWISEKVYQYTCLINPSDTVSHHACSGLYYPWCSCRKRQGGIPDQRNKKVIRENIKKQIHKGKMRHAYNLVHWSCSSKKYFRRAWGYCNSWVLCLWHLEDKYFHKLRKN